MVYFTDDSGRGVLARFDEMTSDVLDRETGEWVPSALGVECAHGERSEFSLIDRGEATKIAQRFGATLGVTPSP